MSGQQQPHRSSSSTSIANANAPRHPGSAPRGLPAELISEIVQALPIARCLDTDSIKSYMVTPLRHFIRPRYDNAKKLMQSHLDLLRQITRSYNRVSEREHQLTQLANQSTQLANQLIQLHKQAIQLYKQINQLAKQLNQMLGQAVNELLSNAPPTRPAAPAADANAQSSSGSAADAPQPAIDLSTVLTRANIQETLERNKDQLKPHLPDQSPVQDADAELAQNVGNPQFQQAAAFFGNALQLGQIGAALEQFGLDGKVLEAAKKGDLQQFAVELSMQEFGRMKLEKAADGKYKCPVPGCSGTGRWPSEVLYHFRTVHLQIYEHKCDVSMCNHAPFSRREDLDNHKKHVHGQMGDGGEDDEAEVFYTASDHSGGAEN